MDLEGSQRNMLRPVEDTVTPFVWRDVINERNVCCNRTIRRLICYVHPPEDLPFFFFGIQSYRRINSATSPASGEGNVGEPAVM